MPFTQMLDGGDRGSESGCDFYLRQYKGPAASPLALFLEPELEGVPPQQIIGQNQGLSKGPCQFTDRFGRRTRTQKWQLPQAD